VEASTEADGVIRQMGGGEWFGEIGLLQSIPRTASVDALEPCELMVIPANVFVDALSNVLLPDPVSRAMDMRLQRTQPRCDRQRRTADRPLLISTVGQTWTVSRSMLPYAAQLGSGWRRRFGDERSARLTGSIVKLDLSGFTQISEQLALTSRTGAEDLNELLNDVFGNLIDIAAGLEGDVLQFGGDALVIWYEGADHARRAATSTWLQQQAMSRRRVGTHAPRLEMSAGIATGEVTFFITGTSHRELVVLGEVAGRMIDLEHQATASSVLVDESTAVAIGFEHVCRHSEHAHRLVSDPVGSAGRSTRAPGHAGSNLDTEDSDDDVFADSRDFIPPEILAVEVIGPPAGEHRRAAVGFIFVAGMDRAVESGIAAARLEAVTEAVESARNQFKVVWTATDVASDGVIYLLFAGAPVSREGDDERMLHACRHIIERCAHLDIHIGVSSGRVFAADIGSQHRRTYAIIGDTTNLAARLMARAAAGAVYVSSTVIERAGPTHEVEWLESFAVKGKHVPVQAAILGPRVQSGRRRQIHDVPLIGREDELRAVHEFVALVSARVEPGGVIVRGGPGSGKSRLLAAAEQRADPTIAVLKANGSEYERHTPYGVLRTALRELVGDDVADLAQRCHDVGMGGLAPLLALPLGLDIEPTEESATLVDEFVEPRRNELLLALLARDERPVLLIIDDGHLIDRASWSLLDTIVCGHPASFGVLIAAREARPSGERVAGWSDVELQPLNDQHARDLVLAAAGERALTDEYLDRVVEEGKGVPLYLAELGRSPTAEADELPESAEEVIAARLDELDPGDLALLRGASVVGGAARLNLLAEALDDETLRSPDRWQALSDFVTLTNGKEIAFVSELYRRSAYSGLARRSRQTIHGRTADAMLAQPTISAPMVALHLHEASRYLEAFELAADAAATARREGAVRDAAALYRRALESAHLGQLSKHERLTAVAIQAVDANETVGRYADAAAALQLAVECSGWDAPLRLRDATLRERAGDLLGARASLDEAARDPSATVDDDIDRLLRSSSVDSRRGSLRDAWDAAIDALALALARAGADDRRASQALLRLQMVGGELGEPAASEHGSAAVELLHRLGDHRNLGHALLNLGASAKDADHWDEAVTFYRDSAAAYGRVGDVVGRAFSVNNLAEVLLDQGRLDEARREFIEARRIFRSAGHRLGAAATASSLGTIEARQGQHDVARRWLGEARTEFALIRSVQLELDASIRQAENELLSGNVLETARTLRDARALLGGMHDAAAAEASVLRLEVTLRFVQGDDGAAGAIRALLHNSGERHALFESAQLIAVLIATGSDVTPADHATLESICAQLGIEQLPPVPSPTGSEPSPDS